MIDRLPSGAELGLAAVIAARPVAVAAHIHVSCSEVISRWPGLDPAGLVSAWAAGPCPADELDVSGVPARIEETHGPPGALPQARAGPTLAERLRN